MTTANTIPASSVVLRFPPSGTTSPDEQDESYELLELPPEILKQVESSTCTFPLTIRGKPSDDAVLCTPESTYALRSVLVSNSLLVCRDPSSSNTSKARSNGASNIQPCPDRPTLEARDICHQIIECVPKAPDLERIRAILKPSQWRGMDSDLDAEASTTKRKRDAGDVKHWTREQLGSVIQASEGELDAGLRERNVIEYNGRIMMLPSKELVPLLHLILTLLSIHGTASNMPKTETWSPPLVPAPTSTCPIGPIITTLRDDHSLPGAFIRPVLNLFGEIIGEQWEGRLSDMVTAAGLGVLEGLPGKGVTLDEFYGDWDEQIGDEWRVLKDLTRLQGNYLLETPATSLGTGSSSIITHFPVHQLSLNPATRFADLFLTKPKWQAEDMAPFLRGLTRDGDTKARDKLVTKFVRVVKDRGKDAVTWWHPRKA